MGEDSTAPAEPKSTAAESSEKAGVVTVGRSFVVLTSVVQVVCIVGFGCLTKTATVPFDTQVYNNYIGVTVMMFVGFGYLMTFLKHYGLGAVGLTMFITCLGMQVAILLENIFEHEGFHSFELNGTKFIMGDFAVATFLISFGGLIGKVNPSQLVVLVVLEALFYSANTQLFLFKGIEIADAGGSIAIHLFGAYFGLAASWILGKPSKMEKEGSSQISDIFSFVGTVFLWLYWPSFVSALIAPGSVEAETAITNTIMALLGSAVCTFILSAALSGRILRPVDIQNATLAGGVAIGATANQNISPVGALIIGCLAGITSTIGYAKVQGFLDEKLGLHDTCGIHNLHGMPSVLGGVISIFVPYIVDQGPAGVLGEPEMQLLGVVGTLVIAIVSGLITGSVMKLLKDDAEGFSDEMFWEVAEEENKEALDV